MLRFSEFVQLYNEKYKNDMELMVIAYKIYKLDYNMYNN